MRKMFCVALFALSLTGCHRITPNAGEEAVLIHQPYFFGHGGVDDTPVTTGSSFAWWSTAHVMVSKQPQQNGIHFEDLMTRDGVPMDFDSVARIRITDSVKLIREFGPQWWVNNMVAEVQNRVRQAVRKHGMNETAINTTAIDDIDTEVTRELTDYIQRTGLPIQLIDFTVGKANPPDSIETQRIETASQEQRANTEKQKKLAEDQRAESEASRAKADNAYRQALGLSAEQFVALEQVKTTREVCVKTTCTLIVGNAVPIIGR